MFSWSGTAAAPSELTAVVELGGLIWMWWTWMRESSWLLSQTYCRCKNSDWQDHRVTPKNRRCVDTHQSVFELHFAPRSLQKQMSVNKKCVPGNKCLITRRAAQAPWAKYLVLKRGWVQSSSSLISKAFLNVITFAHKFWRRLIFSSCLFYRKP